MIQSTVLAFTGLQSVTWSLLTVTIQNKRSWLCHNYWPLQISQNKPQMKYLWHTLSICDTISSKRFHFCRLSPVPSSHNFTSVPKAITPILRGCVCLCLLDGLNSFQASAVHGCDWQRRVLFASVSGAWPRVNALNDERKKESFSTWTLCWD